MDKEAKEEESKSGKTELEGEKENERVAVVSECICCDLPSGMSDRFPLQSLVEEVVDLSGNEREHWCEVSVCVPASFPSVTYLACDFGV